MVDFAPHALEFLREQHAHRRLGFEHEQVVHWMAEAGIQPIEHRTLPTPEYSGDTLNVSLWAGRNCRAAVDRPAQEVA